MIDKIVTTNFYSFVRPPLPHINCLQLVCWLILLFGLLHSVAQGGCVPRAGDEYWEVSTRDLPCSVCGADFSAESFKVHRMVDGQWTRGTLAELAANMGAFPMRSIIYTHGNWMTYSNARQRANTLYQHIVARTAEPIRFVAFTWPSHRQREGRPVQDIREKAERSEIDAVRFAQFLRALPTGAPIGLIGFSFGSRVTCGGLHLFMGGSLNGQCLPANTEPGPLMRVSLIAPAFDSHWLAPSQHYGQAINAIESLVNIYNSRDPILKRYRFLNEDPSPLAAGIAGFAGIPGASDPRSIAPLQSDARITQYDCRSSIGSTHEELSYYQNCSAFCLAIDNVLGR